MARRHAFFLYSHSEIVMKYLIALFILSGMLAGCIVVPAHEYHDHYYWHRHYDDDYRSRDWADHDHYYRR